MQACRNFERNYPIRDVHWHPWEAQVISSGLNACLACWVHRGHSAGPRHAPLPPFNPPSHNSAANSISAASYHGHHSHGNSSPPEHDHHYQELLESSPSNSALSTPSSVVSD
ncbi:unnamed protein product, partial [Protopolystoma xenopodis]